MFFNIFIIKQLPPEGGGGLLTVFHTVHLPRGDERSSLASLRKKKIGIYFE